ncbi:MAG: tetratricopeptide repeat protein [Planctomycetales bacterium]
MFKQASERQRADPKNAAAALLAAQASLVLEKYPEAVELLNIGRSSPRRNGRAEERLRAEITRSLASAYLQWSDSLRTPSQPPSARAIDLLLNSTRYFPPHPQTVQRLIDLAEEKGEAKESTEKALRDALELGGQSATVHLVLGLRRYFEGERVEAAKHWDQALDAGAAGEALLTAFASTLSMQQPPRTDDALAMVNHGLGREANSSTFLVARATILFRAGKPDKSLSDLLKAVKEQPENWGIHVALARVYNHLKKPKEAQRHQQEAVRLRSNPVAFKKKPSRSPKTPVAAKKPDPTPRNPAASAKQKSTTEEIPPVAAPDEIPASEDVPETAPDEIPASEEISETTPEAIPETP